MGGKSGASAQRSRAKFETQCSICQRIVGVWHTVYNRRDGDPEHAVHAKTTRHFAPDSKAVCRGSLLAIHPNAAIPTRGKIRAN